MASKSSAQTGAKRGRNAKTPKDTPAAKKPKVDNTKKSKVDNTKKSKVDNTKKSKVDNTKKSKVDNTKKSKVDNTASDSEDEEDSAKDNSYDTRTGLALRLYPITSIDASFKDMVDRGKTLGISAGSAHVRIATMCSGTEAPIEAMRMLIDTHSWSNPDEQYLTFEHAFSVEVVPFKQAYISRNTEGCILFNNMLDFINPKEGKAPTAMGSLKTIPRDIDILVAGTSCVDFSNLNTNKAKAFAAKIPTTKKGWKVPNCLDGVKIEDVPEILEETVKDVANMGESSQTFFSMLTYVNDCRPKVVILENVKSAPWEAVSKVWFPGVSYAANWIVADTKEYYLPQTRTRGWMVAVDQLFFGREKATMIARAWSGLMTQLKRRASAPVSRWLLPPVHPLTERARQDDSEKALNPSGEKDWQHSKSRHTRARKVEKLGDDRPLTNWLPTDTMRPYDRIDRLIMKTQGARVQDCIDIYFLRGVKNGTKLGDTYYTSDMRFKNHILDLSQNVDRGANTPIGLSNCITPGGILWITNQSRLLSGFESLVLQGLPVNRIQFATETQDQLRDLAGNAMSTTVVGAALEALFCAIKRSLPLDKAFGPACQQVKMNYRTSVKDTEMVEAEPAYGTTNVRSMVNLFERCRRYCYCNGSAKYSTDEFVKCEVCGAIRCKYCHGNPTHAFGHFERPEDIVSLNDVDQHLMRYFPNVITDMFGANWELADDAFYDRTVAGHRKLMESLRTTVFYYESVRITEAVTILYSSNTAFELRVKLSEKGITWYLYLDGWSSEATELIEQSRLDQAQLQKQPVAKAELGLETESIMPAGNSWKLWSFDPLDIEVYVRRYGNSIAFDYAPRNLPTHIAGRFPRLFPKLRYSMFEYHPSCDAPEFTLHATKARDLFCFKDVAEVGLPDKDGYVVSDECRQLEPHEYRETFLRFDADIDLVCFGLDGSKISAILKPKADGYWIQATNTSAELKVAEYFTKVDQLLVPRLKSLDIDNNSEDQHILAQGTFVKHTSCDPFGAIGHYQFATARRGGWVSLERSHLHHFWDFTAHLSVKLGWTPEIEVDVTITDINQWLTSLNAWKQTFVRNANGPRFGQLPPHQWLKAGSRYVAHHLSEAIADFEEELKSQAPIFEPRVKVEKGPIVSSATYHVAVQYMMNHKAIAQKAAAYMPPTPDARASISAHSRVELHAAMSENLQIGSQRSNQHSFKPFRESLKPLTHTPLDDDGKQKMREVKRLLGTNPEKLKLAPSQERSLRWMIRREQQQDTEPFTEREMEEELVPQLKLRIVGSAERDVCIHGGVLADDVGYGKTVITLSLIHAQKTFDRGTLLGQLQQRNPNRISLQASLILAPPHLVKQWETEAKKFLTEYKDKERGKGKKIESIPAVVILKTMKDLKEKEKEPWGVKARLKRADIIIVSTALLSDPKYYENLALLAGSLDPPFYYPDGRGTRGNAKGRPFEEWYEKASNWGGDNAGRLLVGPGPNQGTLFRDIENRRLGLGRDQESFLNDFNLRKETLKKKGNRRGAKQLENVQVMGASKKFDKADQMFEEYTHILEAFTFARVVYDEFSYSDPAAALFVKHTKAHAKWVLSATPPTQHLKAVCGIANLINVHIARPVHSRAGMPRITEGPKFEQTSNAESLIARKFISDKSVIERHQQGEKFLQTFASANPLDADIAGSIGISEKVCVARLSQYEEQMYLDQQYELKWYNFNAELLPRQSRERLSQVLSSTEWEEADGKMVGAKALVFRASVKPSDPPSSNGNAAAKDRTIRALIKEREATLENALDHLRLIADKAIWLVKRVLGDKKEADKENAKNPALDICSLLSDVWSRDFARFGGTEPWERIYAALTCPLPCKLPTDFTDPGFLDTLMLSRSTAWDKYYVLRDEDVDKISEAEAMELTEDLKRVDVEGRLNMAEMPVLKSNGTKDYIDFRALRPAQGFAANPQDPHHYRNILKAILATRRGHGGQQAAPVSVEEEPDDADQEDDYHPDEGEGADQATGKGKKEKLPTKKVLMGYLRSCGIKFKNSARVAELNDRWKMHQAGTLEPWEYAGHSSVQPQAYPFYHIERKVRGATFTLTSNQVSDTSIDLLKAMENVERAVKQLELVETTTLTPDDGRHWCAACGVYLPVDELFMVWGCGHVLCGEELDSQVCGPPREHRCTYECNHEDDPRHVCPSVLKEAVVPLSKVLRSPPSETSPASEKSPASKKSPSSETSPASNEFSTKTQAIIAEIQKVKEDEYVILFAQFDQQIEELKEAMTNGGIDFTEQPSEDPVSEAKKLKDGTMEKVRILKLNSVTAAGTNLQYANHVMFASPLLVDSKDAYDASMKQARGRCVRYGQKKPVHVYHFVMADTIEVDILELRRGEDIVVPVGKVPVDKDSVTVEEGEFVPQEEEDVEMTDADADINKEVRVKSILNRQDVWRAMNEKNWLTTVGIEY